MDDENTISRESIRPVVRFNIAAVSERMDNDQGGFECHECGWTGVTLPLDPDELGKDPCPECGAEGVENKLSTNINHAYECWKKLVEESEEYTAEFVPYKQMEEQVEMGPGEFAACVNSLLVGRDAAVMFQGGEAVVNLEQAKESIRMENNGE